jgi:uncharacterized phage-associated protein
MAHDARAIANYILDRAEVLGLELSNFSLNKVIYFVHGHYLAFYGLPLVADAFEAWEKGPVLREIYHAFKVFGENTIRSRATKLDFRTGQRSIVAYNFEPAEVEIINPLIDFYAKIPGGKLYHLSHLEGGPWHRTWNHDTVSNPGMVISTESIKRYFESEWLTKGAPFGRA